MSNTDEPKPGQLPEGRVNDESTLDDFAAWFIRECADRYGAEPSDVEASVSRMAAEAKQ